MSVWRPVSSGSASHEGSRCSTSMDQQEQESIQEFLAKKFPHLKIVLPRTSRWSERAAGACQVHESQRNFYSRTISEPEKAIKEEQVKSPPFFFSHFVSLPLAIHAELVEQIQSFSSVITTEMGVDKSLFIKPQTLHFTVLMLKLWNKDLVATASEILQNISSKVKDALNNRPVSVKLKGLDCMQGSPAKARVLYAPVEEIGGEGRLLRACQVIIDAYVEAGLVLEKDGRQALKLHATLMNARWKKGSKYNDTFDARLILERYGLEEWGDYAIREAHLSQRFSFDETGYYNCCASIPFPE